MMKSLSFITALLLTATLSYGQDISEYQNDVSSVDALIEAIYDVISGDADEPRDWDRFHYLFTDDAKLIPTKKQADSTVTYLYWSPADYEKMFTANRTAFFEKELSRKTEAYGNIVHVFSTYETRTSQNGPVTNRGINSFQILKAQNRYYIMNIFWSAESDGFPLPQKYLD